ncbi:MAG: efflux RND transporter permease subunit, partial [Pseudomonadota bacterium]
LIGGLLAILVIYLFLRDAWATAVISASIPLSVIATFFLMDMGELSLNIMSLGGIALAVGLLVDNAIVVLENISRHRSQGASVIDAAVNGASEVSGAVFAATLTTIAVFVPLIFVEGIGGQLFRDQALTVTFALVASLAVALTVIPMLSSLKAKSPVAFPDEEFPSRDPRTRLGRHVKSARRFTLNALPEYILAGAIWVGGIISLIATLLLRPVAGLVTRLFAKLQDAYAKVLPAALQHRSLVLLVATIAMALAFTLVPRLGGELIPQLAQGRFEVQLKLPAGTPLQQTDGAVGTIQARAGEVTEITDVFAVSGSGNRIDANPTEAGENIGNLLVVLDDASERTEAVAIESLRSTVQRIPGATAEFSRPQLFSFATPLEIEVLGYDLETLKTVSGTIAERLKADQRFSDVRSSLEAGHPEIQIRFDQERAAALGLTVRQISDQVVNKLRGEVATRYSWRDRKIDVLVRADEEDRASVEDVNNLIINPQSERPIVLSSVAEIIATEGPAEINRVDQDRAAIVTANLRYGSLKEAVEVAEAALAEIEVPWGVKVQVAGQSEEMDASFQSLLFALGLAIFLVYLVMASQFESLVHPFVILLSVPLALVGAVLALFLTGTPVSVIVFIGLIMLAGIVVNNAIVLVDLINQLRDRGMAKRDAIVEGGRSRLRPIVMTTLTTTLGLLPLALGLGEGAELRTPMAVTVIGGLLVSTLLTLLVVPVMYDLLDRGERRVVAPAGDEAEAV